MSQELRHRYALELRPVGAINPQDDGTTKRFVAALPAGAAGQWCRLTVGFARTRLAATPGGTAWWVKLEASDAARGQIVREAFLGRPHRSADRVRRRILVHLPRASDQLTLQVFAAASDDPGPPLATLQPLTRREATLALLIQGRSELPRAVRGDMRGLAGRVRAVVGQHAARIGEAPPYALWTALYDDWQPMRDELVRLAQGLAVDVAVIGADIGARAATLASLHAQWLQPAGVAVAASPATWQPGASAWTLVLEAGEILAPHGLACFAAAARRNPEARGFYADLDRMTSAGRANPLFKPQPDPWLLRSGLLTHGACLFRSDTLQARPGGAAAWRCSAAVSLPQDDIVRLPFILTHLTRPEIHPAMNVPAGHSLDLPDVSIVIPTSARHAHMLSCLFQVLDRTDYPRFEIFLAVSATDPADKAQARNLARAAALPHVTVLDLQMTAFNYAAVNNAAVRHARGELLLLLNDDVVPIDRDWLQRMVAFVVGDTGMKADIVGARLLYGNRMVQHGGVIMGLANLCEHAFRLSSHDHAGPYGVALLNRQVSAVTAACMLVRRSLFDSLGGMDEAFAIALNDADFCLRARRTGARCMLAAEVTLIHYESLSLGRHYQGDRAGLEALEVRRLHDRWTTIIADDPYYTPSASLEPGREFAPGFPPRSTPFSWCEGDSVAPC